MGGGGSKTERSKDRVSFFWGVGGGGVGRLKTERGSRGGGGGGQKLRGGRDRVLFFWGGGR